MINVIIYEDNEKLHILYKEVINDFFKQQKQKVKIYIFPCYTRNLEEKLAKISGSKIFILDIEVPGKSGLDLARTIRSNGDWMSPLIIITSHNQLKNTGFTSKILMLDFIWKKEDISTRLMESLKDAYEAININNSYTFQYNGEIYHISYEEIYYFEKDFNDNYTFLYTKDFAYKIKESIANIGKKLEYNSTFLKIHRSCIININHIEALDIKKNIIYLGSYSTNLITKESRDFLKKKLSPNKIIK